METPKNYKKMDDLTNAPKKLKVITIYEDLPAKKLEFDSPEVICLDTPDTSFNEAIMQTPVAENEDVYCGLENAPKIVRAVSRIGDMSMDVSTPIMRRPLSPRRLDYSPKECHRVKHVFAFEMLFDEFRQREIDTYNMACENQEGLLCRDCGASVMDHCHCHAFECRECYPEHFCNVCGLAKYVLL